MPIKDIKEFMHWVAMGDETITKRKDMFFRQKKIVEKKIMELQETLNMIDFKCWYYTVAEEDQTEEKVKQMLPQDMPQEIRQKYFNSHKKKESK